jgi:large subunit ribosomal protein L7/L12
MIEKIKNIIQEIKNFSFLELENFNLQLASEFNLDLNLEINNNLIINNNSQNEIIKEEKTTFSLFLTDILPDKKISVLKLIRTVTGLGLKESKEIVDNLPSIIKENLLKEDLDKIKLEFEQAGAIIKIK